MKKGDFVEIEFIGRVAATGEVFDVTSAEEAKAARVYNEKQTYGPALAVIGAHMAVPGVEEQLEKMKPGEEREFEVGYGKAFGKRDPKLIKIVARGKFLEKNINPVPGLFVDIDGMQARIRSVSGGRVVVDFNHPLAGKDLKYKVKVVRHITGTLEKAQALLKHYNLEAETNLKEGVLTLKTEKELPKPVKELLERFIKEWLPEVKRIEF